MQKCFKTINEQLEILKSRGLAVQDEVAAKEFLKRNNYYRVSGYSLTLRRDDVFFKNAEFQNIVDIYEFDHELRNILLNYIERIEVAFKAIYAYKFAEAFGPVGYLNKNNFNNTVKHSEILRKAEEQKISRLPHEAFLKHFVYDLEQQIPLWAYVDLLTIGNISMLYSISHENIKNTVAEEFGITKGPRGRILEGFMHSITIVRNLCAHDSRLYNRIFEQKPYLNKKEKNLLRINNDNNIDNAHLYGFIIIMKRLLLPSEFAEMKNKIITITEKYPFVGMGYYGFRDDWKEAL